jgi:hypothetical protein
MYLGPGFVVKTYDRNIIGNDTSCLLAGLDGADGRSVVDSHNRCQIGSLLQAASIAWRPVSTMVLVINTT